MRCKQRSSSGIRKEKLGRIGEYRKIFVKQICHEFFNPLCIAQGYIYLLEEEKYGKLTPQQKKQINGISKSLSEIEELIKEMIKEKL